MKTAFFSMNQEQEYRDTSERNARSMPALFSQTFTCRACLRLSHCAHTKPSRCC